MSPNRRRLLKTLLTVVALLATPFLWPAPRYYLKIGFNKARATVFGAPNVPLAPARERWKQLLGADQKLPFPEPRILISKSARKLELYDGETLIKSYKIALGSNPRGRKSVKGDGRTPEGEYHICTRTSSRFHLFLGLNFPNTADAGLALKDSVIGESARDSIAAAELNMEKPDWLGPLGGAIGIHGGGTQLDWTLGCIAVEDDAIEELFVATDYWTPVTIADATF